MMTVPSPDTHLVRLIDASCNGTISPEQLEELKVRLAASREARRVFVDYAEMVTELYWLIGRPQAADVLQLQEIDFSFDMAKPGRSVDSGFLSRLIPFMPDGMPLAYVMASFVVCIGLLIGSFIPTHVYDATVGRVASEHSKATRSIVGSITNMLGCRWEDSQASGDNCVRLGQKYSLTAGLLEITYDSGAKVLLQGPVTYEVDSAGSGYLSIGKLTARVERESAANPSENIGQKPSDTQQQTVNPKALFTVRTPTATVSDLGTEFGVQVDAAGTTTSRVYQGSVELRSSKGTARVLTEDMTASVSKNSDTKIIDVSSSSQKPNFIRSIPRKKIKKIDLVDVVAGGNGSSQRRNRGINPINGQIDDKPPSLESFIMMGDHRYHRVEGLPYVDGVLVPDGKDGPVQIDSEGRTFAGFPHTSNQTAGYIWAGGVLPSDQLYPIAADLSGIDYGQPGHGVLGMHSNKAITFDLEAIRQANPGADLHQFRSIVGNAEKTPFARNATSADVWVLVDGQPRFQRRNINNVGAYSITIPIGDNHRFLTLASTDGENSIASDWIIFGDPHLELIVAEEEAADSPPASLP